MKDNKSYSTECQICGGDIADLDCDRSICINCGASAPTTNDVSEELTSDEWNERNSVPF